jgi:hypothetical protein
MKRPGNTQAIGWCGAELRAEAAPVSFDDPDERELLIDTVNTLDMAFSDLSGMIVLNRMAYVGSNKQHSDA